MNGEDQFEANLPEQPIRPIPPAWRAEILAAARAAVPASGPAPRRRVSWSAQAAAVVSAWLWPHPKAWGVLAAGWLVVLGLNLAAREPAGHGMATQAADPPAQVRDLLRQQNQLLAELIGPRDLPMPARHKPAVEKPRSERSPEGLKA